LANFGLLVYLGLMDDQPYNSEPKTGASMLFREVQRYTNWIFWVVVVGVTMLSWTIFIQQIVLHRPMGSKGSPAWLAIIQLVVFGLGIPAFGAAVRLITEVTPDTLRVRLVPLRARQIPLDTIASAFPREYSPMREYGGWGVRTSAEGRAYNASGNKGVQLVLKDGSRILIGSQKPEALAAALRAGGVSG
jgi:hypothetical protein